MRAIAHFLGLSLLCCSFVSGQATVTALEQDFESIPSSLDVTCFRLADMDEVPASLDMKLEVGDELIGTGSVSVELECAGGSLLRFDGRFRLLLTEPSEGQDCAINLLAGNANVTSENPTGMTSGETTMGSAGTIYEFRVSKGPQGIEQECVVYEGQVDVKYGSHSRLKLSGGQKSAWQRGQRVRRAQVQKKDVERVAALYARLDASKARLPTVRDPEDGTPLSPRAVRQDAYKELSSLYQQVLERPQDSEARLNLAVRQLNYSNNDEAFYHAKQAEGRAKNKTEKAYIALTQAALYSEMGDEQRASQQLRRARELDPKIFNLRELKAGKIDKKDLELLIKKEKQQPPGSH